MRLLQLPALHIVSAPNVLPVIALSALSNRIESNRNWDALSLLLSAFVWDTAAGWMNGMCFSQVVRVEGLNTIRCGAIWCDVSGRCLRWIRYDTTPSSRLPLGGTALGHRFGYHHSWRHLGRVTPSARELRDIHTFLYIPGDNHNRDQYHGAMLVCCWLVSFALSFSCISRSGVPTIKADETILMFVSTAIWWSMVVYYDTICIGRWWKAFCWRRHPMVDKKHGMGIFSTGKVGSVVAFRRNR